MKKVVDQALELGLEYNTKSSLTVPKLSTVFGFHQAAYDDEYSSSSFQSLWTLSPPNHPPHLPYKSNQSLQNQRQILGFFSSLFSSTNPRKQNLTLHTHCLSRAFLWSIVKYGVRERELIAAGAEIAFSWGSTSVLLFVGMRVFINVWFSGLVFYFYFGTFLCF